MERVYDKIQESGSTLYSGSSLQSVRLKVFKVQILGEFATSEHKKPSKDSKTISQSCWPDCAGQSIKIVQVEIILSILVV